MLRYTLNKDLGLLVTEVDGHVSLKDIIEHYTLIANDSSLPNELLVLINCSEIRMDVKNKEIIKAMSSLKSALRQHSTLREAIVVSRPYATVIALLFESMAKQFENYRFAVFSTEEAAMKWLQE